MGHWLCGGRSFTLIALFLALGGRAAATDLEDAKAHYEKGVGFYALGKYAEAAVEYERAFELKSDPALLYNAAQAHRLAGNKERALLLYQNYLRLFEKVQNRGEVQRHVAELKRAIETEARRVGTEYGASYRTNATRCSRRVERRAGS